MSKKVDKKDLGKGIRALLKSSGAEKNPPKEKVDASPVSSSNVLEIPIDYIETNPFQPRNRFTEETIKELADSIKVHGIIQPITVRRLNDTAYQIISGERRYRASLLVGLASIPAYVKTADDQEMLEMAIVENIQREDLNPVEIALSYQRLIEECDLTHEDLSERLGKNRSTITNYLRLLKLPPQIQDSIKDKKLSMGHARALAGVKPLETQLNIYNQVLHKSLSVRATEALIRAYSENPPSKKATEKINPEIKRIEESLSSFFNTMVKIKRSNTGKGSIVLPFKNDDELNDILDLLDN